MCHQYETEIYQCGCSINCHLKYYIIWCGPALQANRLCPPLAWINIHKQMDRRCNQCVIAETVAKQVWEDERKKEALRGLVSEQVR
jgi:hypothetical protein